MNVQEFAKSLDGCEYGEEVSRSESTKAKELGFLIVYGHSDDLVEICGVIDDEISGYEGTEFRVTPLGVLGSYDDVRDEDDAEEYFRRKAMPSIKVNALWGDHACPWTVEVESVDPKFYASFMVNEDGEPFCRGVVIDFAKAIASMDKQK